MDNMIQLTRSRALSCSAAHVASSSATRSIEQRCLRIQPHCRAPLLAAAARSRVAPTTARRSRCGRHCRRRPAQPTSCTRDEHTCAPTCKPIERAQCRGCRCACGGGGDTQAVRAAAKRARGCSSAKRTHLHTATAASRTVAAHCARSVRSAPSEARAASASRSSTPDGSFSADRKRANATSMNQQRRHAAAKPRLMRKRGRFESPTKAAAPAANALTGQRTSCSCSATFSCSCRLGRSQRQRCYTGQHAEPLWLRRPAAASVSAASMMNLVRILEAPSAQKKNKRAGINAAERAQLSAAIEGARGRAQLVRSFRPCAACRKHHCKNAASPKGTTRGPR